MRLLAGAGCLVCSLLWGIPVAAQEPAGAGAAVVDGTTTFTLRTSLKVSGLVSRAPDDPALFPDRTSATSFWRLRLEPELRHRRATAVVAYEQRLRVFSASAGLAGLGVLPPDTPAPYRLIQLDWEIADSPNASWRHEIDRAALSFGLDRANVTLGRQAIGWGRGVLFGAVDLFSPFSPLEADREWRRGVDAARADLKLSDRVSFDTVGAFGPTVHDSILAARVRGYGGDVDVEFVGGWRAEDYFAGVTSSAAVGGAEVHSEFAAFLAPEPLPAGGLGDGRVALKAVAGGSYRVPVGEGVLVFAEYHYSGFGASEASEILPLLADPAFLERYLRGDTQILTRHAVAVLASHDCSPELTVAMQWLQNPVDGSGLVAPSATVTFTDRVSMLTTVYVPYGRRPDGLTLNSEYGSAALSGFVQLRVYR